MKGLSGVGRGMEVKGFDDMIPLWSTIARMPWRVVLLIKDMFGDECFYALAYLTGAVGVEEDSHMRQRLIKE